MTSVEKFRALVCRVSGLHLETQTFHENHKDTLKKSFKNVYQPNKARFSLSCKYCSFIKDNN